MHVKLKMLKANPAGTRSCTTLKFVRKYVNDMIMSTNLHFQTIFQH